MGFTGKLRLLLSLISVGFLLYGSPAVAQCTFSGLDDEYSITDDIAILAGSSLSGVFTGPGISGNRFDPSAAGPGTHTVTYADTITYTVTQSGEFSPVSADSGWTTVPASGGGNLQNLDDGLSTAIDIGFTFNFFGVNYTQLYASSNGDITFSPYNANFWFPAVIPSPFPPNNMIALARTDLDAGSPVQSEIRYRVDGTAPNRVFVISYDYFDPRDPNANGAGAVPDVTTQLKLFEATQAIEIHTTEMSSHGEEGGDSDDDGGGDDDGDDDSDEDDEGTDDDDPDQGVTSLQGIENQRGTRAYYVPGRNNEPWTAFNDFVSFTGCSSSQTVTVRGAYTIGGQVSGLAEGNQLVLQNNAGDNLRITANGVFTFDLALEDQSNYDVTVRSQPDAPEQFCTVTNGSGVVSGSSVNDIVVSCSTETYMLTYVAGTNGSIAGSSMQAVQSGEDGSAVTAMPNSGYRFSQWSDGVTDNPRQDLDVTTDIYVTAEFVVAPVAGDTTPPAFGDLPDQSVNAVGLLTERPPLTVPEVVDDTDDAVEVTLVTEQTLFRPGSHQVVWAAEDATGNRAESVQRLNIHPVISLAMDQRQPEGGQAQIRFLLNGPAPHYPLRVGYTVAGTAGDGDHDLRAGTVVFEQGELEKVVTANIAEDGAPDAMETIVVSLDAATTTPGAANFGARREHIVTIVEQNLPPTVELVFHQDGRRARLLTRAGGPVTVAATIKDPNPGDTHTYEWSFPSGAVVTDVDTATKTFDPASLAAGLHHIEVSVYEEEGAAPLSASDREAVLIVEALPSLSSSDDSDGDGITDAVEGSGDAGGDGQPDYLDPLAQTNVVNQHVVDGFRFLVEADAGVRLELGDYALQDGMDGVGISVDRLVGDAESSMDTGEFDIAAGTYVDFQIRRLPLGASARVVIPQRQPVPEDAVYRKYSDGVWSPLVKGAGDGVASTAGAEGVCPPPGSGEYQPGLTAGDWCVQLTLTDGGPNDTDGEINGVITDPGGVGGNISPFTIGGGGSVGVGSLVALVLLACLFRLRYVIDRVLSALAFAVCAALALKPVPVNAAELITGFHPLYLSGSVGYASTHISNSDMNSRFADQGYRVETLSSDGSRYAWQVGLGYRATDRVSLEIGYINLGDVNVTFESFSPDGAVAGIHPESGHGGTVAVIYRHPVTERLGASAKVGAFVWNGDFTTYQNTTWVNDTEGKNRDLYYGLGLDYILSPEWSVGAEIQRFEFEHNPTNVVWLGLQFRFLEWLNNTY